MEEKTMERRAALVTGGAQGIGRAIAIRLLQAGAAVAVVDLDPEALADAQDELGEFGNVSTHEADVAEEPQLRRVMEQVTASHGGVDYLVNNAGLSQFTPFETLGLDEWNRVLAVNLTAMMLLTRLAAPSLRERRGAVVNIASTRASMSEPGSEAYAASKGGVVALTHALAVSLGPNVRVNCISPGWIATGEHKKRSVRSTPSFREIDHAQHPVGRVGKPEDVAELAHYLLSDAAGFVTGQQFTIDGGMTRRMIYAE